MDFALHNYITVPGLENIKISLLKDGAHQEIGGLIVNYAITSKTKAIIPCYHEAYKTILIEENNHVLLSQYSMKKIIDENCKINGASYKGRQDSIYPTMKTHRKMPIALDPIRDIFLIPTHSLDNAHCICINPNHYQDFIQTPRQSNQQQNMIILTEQLHIPTPISLYTMDRQTKKCSDMRLIYYKKRSERKE